MKRIILLAFSLLLFTSSYSQYIGWEFKRISRSVKWECDCMYEIKSQDKEKVEIHFSENFWIIKMTFYFDNSGLCYGYSAYCNSNFEEELKQFVDDNFEYNGDEDFYENKRSYLFYQADEKIKIIHILDKTASTEDNKFM